MGPIAEHQVDANRINKYTTFTNSKTCTFMVDEIVRKGGPTSHGGGEKNSEQDYRHGQRIIFSKGKIIQVSKQKRHLIERDLEALAKKSQP